MTGPSMKSIKGPGEPPREDLERGRVAFNSGDYFRAHEYWEEAWRDLANPERAIVQGLIQIAAGCHHLTNNRPAPAARLLAKGLSKLGGDAPAPLNRFRLRALAADAAHTLATLTSGETRADSTHLKL